MIERHAAKLSYDSSENEEKNLDAVVTRIDDDNLAFAFRERGDDEVSAFRAVRRSVSFWDVYKKDDEGSLKLGTMTEIKRGTFIGKYDGGDSVFKLVIKK